MRQFPDAAMLRSNDQALPRPAPVVSRARSGVQVGGPRQWSTKPWSTRPWSKALGGGGVRIRTGAGAAGSRARRPPHHENGFGQGPIRCGPPRSRSRRLRQRGPSGARGFGERPSWTDSWRRIGGRSGEKCGLDHPSPRGEGWWVRHRRSLHHEEIEVGEAEARVQRRELDGGRPAVAVAVVV
jgi:hypothetical protein